ncbi:MAG: exonuclease SbcCD subunit D [Oscillospiraceae bacterium]|nr:exonuclease SbcCD subunit D [Oscillospiraceae bacterium]
MRFLHLADLHFGKTLHGVNLLDAGDQPHWVDSLLTLAEQLRPDAVVIAGDVYDRCAPPAGAVELLSRMLTGLTELGIQVLLAPGNHDSAQRLAFGRSLLEKQGLTIAPPLTAPGQLARVTLHDTHGPVDFWLMPYLFPALASAALGAELRDYDAAVRAVLTAQNIDFSRRNVLIAHQNVTVGGAEGERGGSESAVGGVGQVDFTAFDGFDYVALGHIHAGYAVGRPAVRYAGSPLCYHFHETRQAVKGPLLIELGAKGEAPTVRLQPIAPLHPMRIAEGSYADIRAAEALRGGEYVSVRLTDQRVSPAVADDLHRLFEARGSLLMELGSSFRADCGEAALTSATLREKGLAELFADFYTQKTNGAAPNDAELALLNRAAELAASADLRLPPEAAQIELLLEAAGKEAGV